MRRQGDYQSTALQAFVGIQNSIVHLNDRITRGTYIAFRDRISGTPTLVSGCCNRSLPPSPPARSTMPSPGPGIHVFDEIDRATDDGFWMPLYQRLQRTS
ncbi:hypothetical protein ACPA9J_27280 [Pseudomonas aeruginosa]